MDHNGEAQRAMEKKAPLDQLQRPTLTIRPEHSWSLLDVGELWRFRDLIRMLATRDLKLRYRQTVLGVTWDLSQTLVPVTIFSMIVGGIGKIAGISVPYFLFVYVGFLTWNAFANTLMKASSSVISDGPLLHRVYFPRIILPLATIGSTFVDIAANLAVFPLFLLLFHVSPPITVLLLPFWLLWIIALAVGLGLYFAAMMVTYRDVKYAVPVLTQFLFYATAIAYPIPALPAKLRPYFHLNPISSITEGVRWSLLGTPPPALGYFIYSLIFTCAVFLWGLVAFNHMQRRFADVI